MPSVWTAMKTWVVNAILPASELNTYVRDNLTFMKESAAWVGKVDFNLTETPPVGWLLCDGKTIGNASSGGTSRANADTEDLFTYLWDNFDNTILVIQDSGGTPTTRGASAAADFAANKRMPLLDPRGRTIIIKDNLGGTSANVVTATEADTIGDVNGEETHTIAIAEMPAHDHGGPTGLKGAGTGQFAGGGGTASFAVQSQGSGTPVNNMQPYITLAMIIRYL